MSLTNVECALYLIRRLDHTLAAVIEHEGRSGALADDLPRCGRVEAQCLGVGEGLSGCRDVYSAQQLVDELHLLTVTGCWSHDRRVTCHSVEDRLYPLHRRIRTADHDKKVAFGRAPDTAGHRGIDDLYPLFSQAFHPALDGGGSDGSHDHDDRARVQRRRGRILAE